MDRHDVSYFLARADTHIRLARQAGDERAAKAHYRLAAAYLDRVHRQPPQPPAVRADAA